MIRIILILSIIGFGSCAMIHRSYSEKMKGYIQIESDSNTYYSPTEVSNIEYNTFLAELAILDTNEWKRCMYDSTMWVGASIKDWSKPLERNYHNHSAFADYPVVNIPFYGAKRYCKWLTNHTKAQNILYRLPTLEEQRLILDQVDSRIKRSLSPGIQKDAVLANLKFRINGTEYYDVDGANCTTLTKAYRQNRQGACSIIGNVAEVNSSGSHIGGGWNSFPSDIAIPYKMENPSPNIGFRVVLEKVKFE